MSEERIPVDQMGDPRITDAADDGRRKFRVRTRNTSPSMTYQADRDRADIRKIIQRYERNGVIIKPQDVGMVFKDVTEFTDFSDLMMQSAVAKQAFMRLPSKVREVFGHDVSNWLDAGHDPQKLEQLRPELEELGVLEPIARSGPEVVPEVVPPVASDDA